VLFLYRLQNPKLVLSIRQILIIHLFSSKGMIYFGGLVLGLLFLSIIYTDDLLDTKIKKPFGYRGKNDYSIHRDVPTSDFL
jgi:hypothetical protein